MEVLFKVVLSLNQKVCTETSFGLRRAGFHALKMNSSLANVNATGFENNRNAEKHLYLQIYRSCCCNVGCVF